MVKLIQDDGWFLVSTKGSHRQFKHASKKGRVTGGGNRVAKYLIVIEKSNTGYGAYAPDLPGCVAAAATREETRKLMEEAIEFHLEGMREDGLPIPGAGREDAGSEDHFTTRAAAAAAAAGRLAGALGRIGTLDDHAQQLLLEAPHLTLQLRRIEALKLTAQLLFGFLRHLRASQHPLIRGLRVIVAAPDAGPLAGLGDQPLGGVEEVHQQPQPIVELVQERDLLLGFEAQVANMLAHHRVVLLLGEAVVVLAIRPLPRPRRYRSAVRLSDFRSAMVSPISSDLRSHCGRIVRVDSSMRQQVPFVWI